MQLLQTKFHIPAYRADAMVAREGMGELIRDDSSVVIVSAPAGFGKTTLLSGWIQCTRPRVAWLSLEKSEDSPSVFWNYLFEALSSVVERGGESALEQVRLSGVSSIETILIGLINEIMADATPFTLVLDDFHVISDRSVLAGMEFLLDHLPAHMRIVISGRRDPGLSLSKYRLSGQLTEIGASRFRFSVDEAELLLNRVHGLGLAREDIVLLREKTEGWAAGLALATLSMKEQKDLRVFIDAFTGSHRFVFDYLMEEVLTGLSPEVREFMLKISVLERFCPDLCQSVSGLSGSGTVFNDVVRNNLFLIPLDHHGEWYRYHHLFREFLLKKLRETADVTELHGRAFCWLNRRGFFAEAFDHGVLAGRFQESAALLAERAPAMFAESGGVVLKAAIDSLPDEVVRTSPELCCYKAMQDMLLDGDFQALVLLDQKGFAGDPTVLGFRRLLNGYRYFYQAGDFVRSIQELEAGLEVLPDRHFSVREMGELVLTISLRYNGDIAAAYGLIRKRGLDDNTPVMRAIGQVDILMGMGRLSLALSAADRSLEAASQRFGETLLPEYGYLYIYKGSILREQDDIPGALKACRQGLNLFSSKAYVEFVFLGNLEYGKILAADGNYTEAERAFSLSLEAARASSTWGEHMSLAYRIRMEISRGDLPLAGELLRAAGDFSVPEIPYHRHHGFLSFCRYCNLQGETETVHRITGTLIRQAGSAPADGRLTECHILQAVAYYLDRDLERALDALQKAFHLTEKEGHVRLYIDEGKPMQALFREALNRGMLPEYLKGYANAPEDTVPSGVRSVMIHDFQEIFNEREIEILQLMKRGASNKIIADTLFLSVNTVRWYASRLFAKLNVKRRGEAVAVAEKYELI